MKVNIYYQGHKKKIEINVIGGQKCSIILGMLQLTHYSPKIDWRTGEIKMRRCPKECGKQWRLKQAKSGQEKQKKKGKKERKKPKKERTMEIKKIAEEQEIWDEEEESVKLEEEAKWLVLERFYKQIHIFGQRTSK